METHKSDASRISPGQGVVKGSRSIQGIINTCLNQIFPRPKSAEKAMKQFQSALGCLALCNDQTFQIVYQPGCIFWGALITSTNRNTTSNISHGAASYATE